MFAKILLLVLCLLSSPLYAMTAAEKMLMVSGVATGVSTSILGYNTQGASLTNIVGTVYAYVFTAPAGTGSIKRVKAYAKNLDSSAHNLSICVYSDSGGEPSTQLAIEINLSVPGTNDGLVSSDYSGGSITGGNQYWIAVYSDNWQLQPYYTEIGYSSQRNFGGSSDLPALWPTETDGPGNGYKFSIWVEYE